MPLRIRRGTDAERLTIVPLEGELIYTTDTKKVYVGDGTSLGGVDIGVNISGTIDGDIFLNGFSITGIGSIDIDGSITATSGINGDLRGSVFADSSTVLVDGVAGVLRGQHIGNVIGNVFGDLTGNVTGDLSGNVTGNLTGNVTGSLTGNVNGTVVGELVGSVFSDNSSLLVDGINGAIVGPVVNSITDIKIFGGLPGQAVTTDGNGNLSFVSVAGSVDLGTSGELAYYSASGSTVEGLSDVVWNSGSLDINGAVSGTAFFGEIDNNFIYTTNDTLNVRNSPFFNFGSAGDVATSEFTIEKWNDSAPAVDINTVGKASFTSISRLNFKSYHGGFSSPVLPTAGDYIGAFSSQSYDPGLDDFIPNAIFLFSVDNQETVSAGTHKGKVEIVTNGGSGASPTLRYMTFDSSGRLAVNQKNAAATVDINGVMRLAPQTAAPGSPVDGMIAVADRVNWDPASKGSGGSYPVYYDGSVWNAFY